MISAKAAQLLRGESGKDAPVTLVSWSFIAEIIGVAARFDPEIVEYHSDNTFGSSRAP
jgi:hypothetical protein